MRLWRQANVIITILLSFVFVVACILPLSACGDNYVPFPYDNFPSTGYTYIIEHYEKHNLITPKTTLTITCLDDNFDKTIFEEYNSKGIAVGAPLQYKFENLTESFKSIRFVTDKTKEISFDYYLIAVESRYILNIASHDWSEGFEVIGTNIKFICKK